MTRLNTQWNFPPVDYKIDHNTVHVWRAYFQPVLVSNREFLELISKEELERARRFIRESDRNRCIFSHGLLRSLLSAYVNCSPQQLSFETKQYHKPFLISPDGSDNIRFNMSHSEDMVLIALTRGSEVGIDVERVRKIPDALQIVNSTFSINERKFLNSLPLKDFEEGFFSCWTSKEAFLKGIGKGLSYPLDKFSINFPNTESEGSVCIHDDPGNTYCWKIIRLSPGQGYSGALAIEELRSEPQFFEYCWD